MNELKRLLCSTDGATIVEYAVMLAFIALVCIGLIVSLGSSTSGLFAPVTSKWNGL